MREGQVGMISILCSCELCDVILDLVPAVVCISALYFALRSFAVSMARTHYGKCVSVLLCFAVFFPLFVANDGLPVAIAILAGIAVSYCLFLSPFFMLSRMRNSVKACMKVIFVICNAIVVFASISVVIVLMGFSSESKLCNESALSYVEKHWSIHEIQFCLWLNSLSFHRTTTIDNQAFCLFVAGKKSSMDLEAMVKRFGDRVLSPHFFSPEVFLSHGVSKDRIDVINVGVCPSSFFQNSSSVRSVHIYDSGDNL